MSSEQTFRLVATTVILLAGPVGVCHRLRAQRLGAKVTRAEEPPIIRYPLKLCALAGLTVLILWFVRPSLVEWAAMPLENWVRWLGAAMALAAVPLLWWTFHTLGLNLTDTVATRANSYLVTNGPYRWVRHPFYVTIALFFGGMSLVTALWPLALSGVAVLSLLALRTPIEERKLIERFGEAYVEYAAKTGRYVPRFGRGQGTTSK